MSCHASSSSPVWQRHISTIRLQQLAKAVFMHEISLLLNATKTNPSNAHLVNGSVLISQAGFSNYQSAFDVFRYELDHLEIDSSELTYVLGATFKFMHVYTEWQMPPKDKRNFCVHDYYFRLLDNLDQFSKLSQYPLENLVTNTN